MSKLCVLTLSLDSFPWISNIFVELNRLRDLDWEWVVVSGVANAVKDTAWIAQQQPRLSRDGSHEWMLSIAHHPRVKYIYKTQWEGKVEMLNAGLQQFSSGGVLLEADSDELWTADQMRKIVALFDDPSVGSARFKCDYFVGANIVTEGDYCYGSNYRYEWDRAFRWKPGQYWTCHEPPRLSGVTGRMMLQDETEALVGRFQHYSWPTAKVVSEKARLYQYPDALASWEALQSAEPGLLKHYLPWADERVKFRRVF